ncbi:MAG: hypothetical protein K0S11_592 [Gammaproteobacteria bacterium]|jgi:hypothetical protein|nr:hypothetical protein [Gammaproteobacteria bacterium]
MSKSFRTSPSMELLTELIQIKHYNIHYIAQATQLPKLTLNRVLQGKTQHLRRQNFCKLLAFYCQTLSY